MLHTPQNARDKKLVDALGKVIPYVETFDDVTNIATIFIQAKKPDGSMGLAVVHGEKGNEILKASVKVPGGRMVSIKDLETGESNVQI